MNAVDVIFFQAEIAPDKLALVAHGSIIPYNRFVYGILSAQQRLSAIGVQAGQTVALSIAHPIDHMVFACALYRMKVASASITSAVDTYLDRIPFDMVLSDKILTTVATKQPSAKFLLVDPAWFQDKVELTLNQRTRSRRGAADWTARATCYGDRPGIPPVIKTTAQALEEQLMSYCISAPPSWDRMISVAGLQTNTGFIQVLSALWLGRSVCLADLPNARGLSNLYKHDYLVVGTEDVESLLRLQEVEFEAMKGLRAACFEGRANSASMMKRGLATISSNLLVRYVHPEAGIVAYGDAARFRDIDGAAGFVAPWADIRVVDETGAALPTGREGNLRFRRRDRLVPEGSETAEKSDAEALRADDDWINLRQRGKISANNLLVITGAAA
jgi:hypothetical protein